MNHFACSSCDQKMTVKTKFYEVSKWRLTWWDKMKRAFRTNIKTMPRNQGRTMKKEFENMEHNINLRTILMPSLQQVDLKPVCKKCYDRYPREMRLRLKKWEKNNVFFLQDYSFQIYDYLQVSRGRSNSRPTRGVSLVEVNSPTNRLPNHRSTKWRS